MAQRTWTAANGAPRLLAGAAAELVRGGDVEPVLRDVEVEVREVRDRELLEERVDAGEGEVLVSLLRFAKELTEHREDVPDRSFFETVSVLNCFSSFRNQVPLGLDEGF